MKTLRTLCGSKDVLVCFFIWGGGTISSPSDLLSSLCICGVCSRKCDSHRSVGGRTDVILSLRFLTNFHFHKSQKHSVRHNGYNGLQSAWKKAKNKKSSSKQQNYVLLCNIIFFINLYCINQ